MQDEHDNPVEAGNEDVQPLDDDTMDDWDGDDLEEDTGADPSETMTDEEEQGEADETEGNEDPEVDDAEPEAYADETARVKLPDGAEMTVAELTQGHMRQADYTRKTTEVAQQRKQVEADAQQIGQVFETFIDHISKMVPEEPDHNLALTDPAAFTRQKAQHDAAVAQVQQLLELSQQPRELLDRQSQEDRQKFLAEEGAKLKAALPETATEGGMKKFWGQALETAEHVGFTAEELQQVSDHRLFVLADWARKGMEAEKARSEAKAKIAKAPQKARKAPATKDDGRSRAARAMKSLAEDDSFENAIRLLTS